MKRIPFISVIVTISLLAFTSQVLSQGAWQTKAAMPGPRDGAASCAAGGKLYAFGGYDGTHLGTSVAYDPATDTWSAKAPMPVPRSSATAVEAGGKIYVLGGFINGGTTLTTRVDVYDPATDSWDAPAAAMPTVRTTFGAAAIDGIIYAAGGATHGYSGLSTLEAYNPVNNTWTTKASMPGPQNYPAVGVINGLLYLAGSADANVSFVAYDPVTDTWSVKPPLPTSRFIPGGAVLGGKLYIIGGSASATLSLVEIYDPVTNSWSVGPSMPTDRYNFGIAVVDGVAYAYGGATSAGGYTPSSTLEAYTLGVDVAAPEIAVTSPANGATYFLGQSVIAQYSCDDEPDGSGIASCIGSVPVGNFIDTSSIGVKTFTINAEDNAGNTNSEEVSYNVIYDFAGFFQPVQNLPTLNVANSGSAIPLKFSLSGNQGLGILSTGYPVSGPIACDATEPGAEIEETATAGGSTLSFDAAADQYKYVWKTNKAWKGSCRILVVRLIDGTDHFAKFRFK